MDISTTVARCLVTTSVAFGCSVATHAQTLSEARDDQIARQRDYLLDSIVTSGLVRDSLVLDGPNFHPATPDAAGFALIGLAALDHVGELPNAPQLAENVLSAYAGHVPGVNPARSPNGHFTHYMTGTGAPAGGGWDPSYTTIGTALLVAGAQFAKNHFVNHPEIAELADELTSSVDFNAAIDPDLSGRVYRDMKIDGSGTPGVGNQPWNEYMLVVSLALKQAKNDRALAIRQHWIDPDAALKRDYLGIETLTDNPAKFAPAFWVQQQHFFNGDFRHHPGFEQLFRNQQLADQAYSSSSALGETFRYGLTAGPSPQGYGVDRIGDHQNDVFSPEAVAAWGDMDTFLQFFQSQYPTADPRYRYGLLRESAADPNWVPFDAGLVDHLFLLFGLVESIDPTFFADRVMPRFAPGGAPGDFNGDGAVDAADYAVWRNTLGSAEDGTALSGNGNGGTVDYTDLGLWRNSYGASYGNASPIASAPEPMTCLLAVVAVVLLPTTARKP